MRSKIVWSRKQFNTLYNIPPGEDVEETEPLFQCEFKEYLESLSSGRSNLRHRRRLCEKDRIKLTTLVVEYLLRLYKDEERIPEEIFEQACDEIITEFPKEERATYFVPSKPRTAHAPRVKPRGALRYKYMHCLWQTGKITDQQFEDNDEGIIDNVIEREAKRRIKPRRAKLQPRAQKFLEPSKGKVSEWNTLCIRIRWQMRERHYEKKRRR